LTAELTVQRTASTCFDLAFSRDRSGRTFLGAQFVKYPVHVGRGLHLDETAPGAVSVMLQSVSGGLFESDVVAGRIMANEGAQVCVSTSASTIVHAMRGVGAEQSVDLQARPGAFLQYLPEPLILFPTSRLRGSTTVRVSPGATVLFCESFLAHDPLGQGRPFDALDLRVDVRMADGRLLARDRMVLGGEVWQARRVGISARHAVHGSVWLIGPGMDETKALLAALRQVLDTQDTVYAGASSLPHQAGLQVRILCQDAVALRQALQGIQRICSVAQVPGASPSNV
jgi:urease accessory protein